MASYFIDSILGSDSNSGTSSVSPWKTISKINSSMGSLNAGDSILFKSGDIFIGSLTINTNGNSSNQVLFGSYGTGNKPVISGFLTVSSWVSLGGGIWESNTLSVQSSINIVTINDVQYSKGRYPFKTAINGGYLNISSSSLNSVSTTSVFPYTFTNSTIVARTQHWRLDTAKITAQSGSTLNYSSGFANMAMIGFGFFIQDNPNVLAAFGDWYFDTTTNKIRIFFGASNPNTFTVKVSSLDTLIEIQSEYNTITNLEFEGANKYAISAQTSKHHNNVTNCDFWFIGLNGVYYSGQINPTISGNTFNYVNNIGVFMGFVNVLPTIDNNIFNYIGTIAGAGLGGFYTAINSNTASIITNNSIWNVGYAGISFGGTNGNIIQNNYVSDTCLLTDDGSGIYGIVNGTNANSNLIDSNIVINSIGQNYGTTQTDKPLAHGIYFDAASTGFTCTNNTCISSSYSGIFIHGNNRFIVSNNTLYNNGKCQLFVQDNNGTISQNGVITNNIFFSEANQLCLLAVHAGPTSNNMMTSIGTMNNNAYCRPSDESNIINNQYSYSNHFHNLSSWKTTNSLDLGSNSTPTNLGGSVLIKVNPSDNSVDLLTDTWTDMFSNTKTGVTAISSYRSLLLLKTTLGPIDSGGGDEPPPIPTDNIIVYRKIILQ